MGCRPSGGCDATMRAKPVTQRVAYAWIKEHHRHHLPPRGDLFRVAAEDDQGNIIGVVVIGRPVSRQLQDGRTAEVTRLCTNGTKNVCSFLLACAWRAARALGYDRIYTYIKSQHKYSFSRWVDAGCPEGLSSEEQPMTVEA